MSTPAGALAAVVPWDEFQPAAEYLRIHGRESTSRSPYGTVVLPSYVPFKLVYAQTAMSISR
jgi:hypothetical protein